MDNISIYEIIGELVTKASKIELFNMMIDIYILIEELEKNTEYLQYILDNMILYFNTKFNETFTF